MAFRSLLVVLFLLGHSVAFVQASAQDSAMGELDVPDPAHDVKPTAAQEAPAGAPGAGPTGPHDLLRFRVFNEDADGLEFELQIADINAPGAFTTVNHVVSFGLAGTSITYVLSWSQFSPLAAATLTGSGPEYATFCYQPDGERCYAQRIIATRNWDTSTLWARISKDALKGLDPLPGPNPEFAPRFAGTGAQLDQFFVLSIDADAGTTGEDAQVLYDRVPDSGFAGPFDLTEPLAYTGLRVRLDPLSLYENPLEDRSNTFPIIPVPPGVVSMARVRVYNDDPTPKIVNLSHEFQREGPTDAWGIRLVSSLKVPGSGSRLVNVVFTGADPIPFETRQLLVIKATTLTEPRVSAATAFEIVSSAPPPGPDRRELFLHLGSTAQSVEDVVNEICRVPFCGGVTGWMNTERVQTQATEDDGRVWGYDITFGFPESQTQSFGRFSLDYAAVHDLVIGLDGNVGVTIGIDAQSPIAGTMRVQVLAAGALVAMGTKDVSISGLQDIVFDLPMSLTTARLPAGSNITLDVLFVHETSAAPSFAAAPPRFIPSHSKIVIPFVEDPSPKDETIPAGPALIGLSTSDAREIFVNPGHTTLVNVTVVNEGLLKDVVHIDAMAVDPTWTHRIVPATDFRLDPGESAVVGVYVTAPSGAAEGDQTGVEVRATSSADPDARAKLGFLVQAVTGLELADEADTYQVDEDTQLNRVEPTRAKTPSPGAASMLVFLVVAAISLRVRTRRT